MTKNTYTKTFIPKEFNVNNCIHTSYKIYCMAFFMWIHHFRSLWSMGPNSLAALRTQPARPDKDRSPSQANPKPSLLLQSPCIHTPTAYTPPFTPQRWSLRNANPSVPHVGVNGEGEHGEPNRSNHPGLHASCKQGGSLAWGLKVRVS